MHQVLSRKDALAFIAGRHDGSLVATDLQAGQSVASAGDWWDQIEDTLSAVMDAWSGEDLHAYESQARRDGLEGVLAAVLHQGLKQLPAVVLTDRDFWRYCAAYMYDFIVWRQPSKTLAALHPYFGVSAESLGHADCVPHRMYNRAHIVSLAADEEADPYALAKFGAADVWKSHILRVRNSYAPEVVKGLLEGVRAGRFKTEVVRDVAKDLKRVRSNVLFEVIDREDVASLLGDSEARVAARAASLLDAVRADD